MIMRWNEPVVEWFEDCVIVTGSDSVADLGRFQAREWNNVCTL